MSRVQSIPGVGLYRYLALVDVAEMLDAAREHGRREAYQIVAEIREAANGRPRNDDIIAIVATCDEVRERIRALTTQPPAKE